MNNAIYHSLCLKFDPNTCFGNPNSHPIVLKSNAHALIQFHRKKYFLKHGFATVAFYSVCIRIKILWKENINSNRFRDLHNFKPFKLINSLLFLSENLFFAIFWNWMELKEIEILWWSGDILSCSFFILNCTFLSINFS